MSDITAAKARLRAQAIAIRDALPAGMRRAASRKVAEIGLVFAAPRAEAVVSGFMAIGAEIDASPLLERLHGEGYPLALPVIRPKGQPLSFRSWAPGEPLTTRMWGIREPLAEAPEIEPDILLVPLLAFDAQGHRLGYGAGYYDHTLKRLRAMKPLLAIGLAYDEQEVASVPHQDWDQRLDWMLTPSGPRRSA
jgi:5-formyltetrahydrofolate cyclo-ligase